VQSNGNFKYNVLNLDSSMRASFVRTFWIVVIVLRRKEREGAQRNGNDEREREESKKEKTAQSSCPSFLLYRVTCSGI
jgi:uncharacterized protein with von Willebrand factor type A (vWA) domain